MMNDKLKRLSIYTPQGSSGILHKDSRFVFNYDTPLREREVSLGMPLRAESYGSSVLHPIFAMNRPEGYLLERIRRRFAKVYNLDDMRLLALTGSNQIGRLRFYEPDIGPEGNPAKVALSEVLKSKQSAELFEYLVDTYLQSGISGFQPKVMIPDLEGDSHLGERATIATPNLIVKASGDDYPHLAQNEFLCMEAARVAGIRVPEFWLSDSGDLFVMKRFDIDGDQQLGQEDMTVLMNRSAEQKYEGSYENVVRVIDAYCRENAAESAQRFFEYFALSVMVRNSDAHLKNFSLAYEHPSQGSPMLSPLYDVVTTTVYRYQNRHGVELADRQMALKLNKERKYPSREEVLAFGKTMCRVSNPEAVIERISDAMAEVLRQHADRIDPRLLNDMRAEWDGGRMSMAPDHVYQNMAKAKLKAPSSMPYEP
ncbi:type II toxin-antitoxin system HipA family toxin [Ralstonia sp. ASV6]|uniref:type II toxin-antitoxin system HipA family toxin n=1 Tax=Ralstonia sp. ASV6 TaxID=2795124 RepID=UPI001E5097C3|nr:type II toxin-antitoxin system HipA family toxin [Ralstonia sp. ASV6]